MQLIKQFVIHRGERHLKRYREDAKNADGEFLRQYRSYLPQIEHCYTQAGFWHGTGRYHYIRTGDARYNSAGEYLVDVLKSITESGGLRGHQDLWVTLDNVPKKTISLAPYRMHSRLYAHIHLREGVLLKFIFGGTRFWTGMFVFLAVRELLGKAEWYFIKQAIVNRKFLRHARTWASAIRDLSSYKRMLPVWRAYDLRSDIVGNYAILFGIKREAIQGEGILPFLKHFEVRIPGPLPIADMTHIEVPLEHIEETKRLLFEQRVTLPVIPLEFGEIYCTQFPLTTLTHV